MEEIKKQIVAWFNSPQDYDQGMDLLRRISRKNRVIGKLLKRGETRASFEKLVYELNKIAGLKKIPVPKAKVEANLIRKTLPALKPERIQPQDLKTKKNTEKKTNTTLNLAGKIKGDMSLVMQRVVKENSTLCMQRGKKHSALVKLAEDNSDEAREKRVKLMDDIEAMTKRIEVLFVAWTEYNDKKAEPDPAALWPEESDENENENANSDLSIEDMKREKKNLQSSITKDRNLLLYGTKAKPEDGKEKPMPEKSPKRIKLEKRIAKKEALIADFDRKIAEQE